MKFALITDIHANAQALEAVLADAATRGVDRHVFLGDLVGYGGDPAGVVDRIAAMVRDEGAIAVRGNHDHFTCHAVPGTMHPDAAIALEWTREKLSPAQLDFLGNLPITERRGECLFVHASAYQPASWIYIQGRAEAMQSLQATDAHYTFCGHMHEPMLYHMSGTGKAGDFRPEPDIEIPLLPHRQWLVIPGSCGQPRDGNPAACYAVFDDERSALTYHRVPYDVEAAAARIREAGLPERLAARLSEGH
jgi:diadenosine tetraphosphatase ApaH/serine/threonine PP2A family protein phosphatase